jgi:hypothetical protein
MEDGKSLERIDEIRSTVEEPFGVKETACIESAVRNWRDPTLHSKAVKRNHISQKVKLTTAGRVSEGFIVPKKLRTT